LSKKTWIFVGVITLIRSVISFYLPLHPDECYYWLLSRHLALSYFDHPPLVAYLIRLTTIFSDQQFFVRLTAIVLSVLLSFLIYRLTLFLFNSADIASGSVIILNLYPLTASGIIITPDTPAFFFFALAVYLFARIVFGQSPPKNHHWIYLGISLGLGLLSKYTTILFFAGMFIFLGLDRRAIARISVRGILLALSLALVIFSPVIIWNWQNGWISFAYQWRHGTSGTGHWLNLLTFWAGQVGAGGIFLFLIGIVASIIFLFSKNKPKQFLVAQSLPIFIFFSIVSYKKSAEVNWPSPAFFTLAIITAVFLLEKNQPPKKLLFWFSNGFCALLVLIIYWHSVLGIIPLAKINPTWVLMDPTNRCYGWSDFTKELSRIANGAPIISTEHQSAASILYHSRQKLTLYCSSNNFVFWQKNLLKSLPLPGRVITYEYFTDVSAGNLKPEMFDRVNKKWELLSWRNNQIIRRYNIYECWNFRGF